MPEGLPAILTKSNYEVLTRLTVYLPLTKEFPMRRLFLSLAALAVLVLFSVQSAEAGLFGRGCCAEEKSCCAAEPTCCPAEPTCCDADPCCKKRVGLLDRLLSRRCCKPACETSCGAPEPTCCPAEPTCCEEETSCCKRPRLLDLLRARRCNKSSCCEETSCCSPEPSCCGK